MKDNPIKQNVIRFPYHDYGALIYEELNLKKELSQKQKIPFNSNIMAGTLHTNKFDS